MEIYAWCNSRLWEHSIDTVLVTERVKRLKNICEVLAFKLRKISAEVDLSMGDAYELILTAIALHDVGKACTNYQKTIKLNKGKCEANFKYHEVVGASLFAEALIYSQIDDVIKYVITLAVLNHHHALRDLNLSISSNFKDEVAITAGELANNLINEIINIKSRLTLRSSAANDVFENLLRICNENINLKNTLNYFIAGINGKQGGYEFLLRNTTKTSYYIVSSLSGLINISDSLSAHCRRGGANIFIESILKELGISCNVLSDL